jgi:glucan phosphorylase
VNKDLYNKTVGLPKEVVEYLQSCFDMFPNSDPSMEGHKRNEELRNTGYVTYQQLGRMKNWFDNYQGDGKDAPFILNGADYVKDWVNSTLDTMRSGDQFKKEVKQDYLPSEVDTDLAEKMGWLSDMNRPSKEHSTFVQDVKITEDLKRINQIMKKII